MHRVVPELIVEKYRAGIFRGEFPAVGMFLDLSGFSTMTDTLMQHGQHGAEVLANLMHGVFDPLVESIFDYGGKIVGFAGDGMMALYPMEQDIESTCLRALASARLVQQRLVESSRRQTIYGAFQFTARIGLAIGDVSWGIVHSDDRQNATYYFRGSAVDDSAHAEQHAEVGEILITKELCDVVGESLQIQPSGSFYRLNGFHVELPHSNPTVFPAVDINISRIFMPEDVILHDARGEFRQIANLFMRFPDMTNEKLEDLTRVLFNLRKQYGGLLNRIDFGDKGCNILMLWGAPVAYENDINRALNFVLDLQKQVEIPVTAGVTYYVAHAGYLGSTMCEDYTCYGWGVNLASRLMMTAPLGEIWIDDRIARRASNRFEIEYVSTRRFKGFSAEQQVHRLKSYNLNTEAVYHGEIIGREREISQLEKFIDPIWNGEFAGVCLILGDAGIGKGRLVQGFRASPLFHKRQVLWAFCQSEQILRQSFNPFRSWLFHYFGFTTAQDKDTRKQIFDAKLDDLLRFLGDSELEGELKRLRSVLGALVDLFWVDSLYEQLDAEARYNSAILALIALIKAESLRQPLILFVEDTQFIDEDSLNFLPRLKRSLVLDANAYPAAIIMTSRSEHHDAVIKDELADSQIILSGLPREAVARLVEILLGGVPSLSLVNFVMERSEGNPYFVEQILRYLQDENLIEMSADGWKQLKQAHDSFLPGDIGALLVARLDQLSRKVKDLVQTASVFGREFLIGLLREMTAEGDALEQYVNEAEQSVIWTGDRSGHYTFTHGLLRDAAYTMQMRARRQELHALAVKAFEKIFADELNFHYPELAYHAERAELREKAQRYYTKAGKAASDVYQNARGIEYLSRALSFTPDEDRTTQFDVLVEREELFKRLGNHQSHLKDIEALERLAQELGDTQRVAMVEMLYTHYFVVRGDYPAVIQHATRVVASNRNFIHADILLKTYQVWPLALLRMGKLDDAMKTAQEGRRLAQEYGDLLYEGYILMSMGLIAIEQNDPSVAHEYFLEALAIAHETKNRRLESRLLANLGYSAGFILQDYGTASEYYKSAHELYRQFGELSQQSTVLGNLGWVAGMMGDFDSAFSYYSRALALSREVGNPYNEAYQLINLSNNLAIRDEVGLSQEYAQNALALCRRTHDRSGEAWALLYLAYAKLQQNDLAEAENTFKQSILIREELRQPLLKTEPQAGLIQTFLSMGKLDLALAESETIIPYLQNGNALQGTEEPLRVYYACYLALEKMKDPRSQVVLQSAVQLLETQVSKLQDENSRRMFVDHVPWRLAIHQAGTAHSS